MPCDTIQMNRVELGAMHPGLLTRALEALGAVGVRVEAGAVAFQMNGIACTIAGGILESRWTEQGLGDTIKRAYAAEAVKEAARKNGWTVKATGPNQFQVIRGIR